jgi:Predicted nucleic-acid-binding protein, contains PIN domain
MKTYFLDTNLFIRYLTNDDPPIADRVEKLLTQATEGKMRLVTAEMVIAEIVWVLESVYHMNHQGITPLIKAILATPGLEVTNAGLVSRALDYYNSQPMDFVDGYIIAMMEKMGIEGLYSFDKKHLSTIKGIRRLEP